MIFLLQHGFRNCWQLYRNVCLKNEIFFTVQPEKTTINYLVTYSHQWAPDQAEFPNKVRTFPWGYPNNRLIEAYWGGHIEVALLFRNNWCCCIAAALFNKHNWVSWGQPIISGKLRNPPEFINVLEELKGKIGNFEIKNTRPRTWHKLQNTSLIK